MALNSPEKDLIKMMSALSKKWDGHHDRMSTTRYRIKLTSEKRLKVRRASIRARLRTWYLAATEIDKMLREHFNEPEWSEWVGSIAFVSKKNGSLRFLSTIRS